MYVIAGVIDGSRDRAEARVALLNQAQWHRGADHDVVTSVGGFTLGNTRLAVEDPGPAANQPFVSADGRYYCVFNGEIYKHQEFTRRFGLDVRTQCDGKVISVQWPKLGIELLAELRGMFTIELVNSQEERIYLARGPLGIKPLYWRIVPAVVRAADDPAAAVWSVLDRSAAGRSRLIPLQAENRWSEAWFIAALNAWLGAIEGAS